MVVHSFEDHVRRYRQALSRPTPPALCRLEQKISFDASEMEAGSVVEVDIDLVKERVSDMLEGSDLSKYII